MEITKDKVTELFCIIDEFYKVFDAENAGKLLLSEDGVKRRRRKASLSYDHRSHRFSQIFYLLKSPQISQIPTDFLPLKVTQISQMTQIFYLFTFFPFYL